MDTLPNELFDHVIAHVAHSKDDLDTQDTTSLANCCHVSRRFYATARPLLYDSIHLELNSDEPELLLDTFTSDPQLAKAVKTIFVHCNAPCTVPTQCMKAFRDFLAGALPLCTNLTAFRSNHRISTIKLVETTLYHDTGYSMGVPRNLENIRTLELFAADYIYKYNYILRLPHLERVVLHSTKIVDLDGDDRAYSTDWQWESRSIKELEIHQGFRSWNSAPYRLRTNSLQALAKSLPCLESLRLYHYECTLYPRQSRHLLGFFTPQLRSSLRRLIIEDGRIDARHPELGYNYLASDGLFVMDELKTSNLEYLFIDLHMLCTSIHNMGLAEAIDSANLPPSLRHLHLRHVEVNDLSSVGDTSALLSWACETVVNELVRRCLALVKIGLELRLLRDPDHVLLDKYKDAFASRGIRFDVLVHECPAQQRTPIICSR